MEGFSASLPKVWNVPRDNPNFVGREDLLKNIFTGLHDEPTNTIVINGPQGFGKSQMAKHYVHQHFEEYDVVWWFRANQYINPQFEKFSLEIASHLGLDLEKTIHDIAPERLVSLIKEAIRRKNLKCLIIFDDAQTYKDIEPYLLFSHKNMIHTLVTTKNATFSEKFLQIQPFKRTESIQYIQIFLARESQKAKELLANHLSDCPIALALAVDYIKYYPGMTIERYIVEYRKAQEKEKTPFSLTHTADKKLGGSIDGYEKDLLIAVKMNLSELKKNDAAFQLLGLLSLLHRDEIPVTLVESFLQKRGPGDDLKEVMGLINQYSFIEITAAKNNKGAYMSMQELVQQIVNSLIPIPKKKELIDEGVELLKPAFSNNADKNVKAIMKDNNPLLNAIKLSQEANSIDHHNQALSSLRVRLNRVLIGGIRDLAKAKEITEHLQKDFDNHIKLLPEDEIIYNMDLFLFHRICSDFERAVVYAERALKLSDSQKGMYEEKLRLYGNLMIYYALVGLLDECQPFITKGEQLFTLSQSQNINAHYIYALSLFLTERGEFPKVVELIEQNKGCLEKQECHPFMHFFVRFQFAEALLKNGDIKRGKEILASTAKLMREYYDDEDNHFFGKLFTLEAVSKLSASNPFSETKSLLQKAIRIYEKAYKGSGKHRHQSYAYLQLAKLFHLHRQYNEAKTYYIKCENILEGICKSLKMDEVSELYKQLAILGVDTKDEVLAHTYIKKQISTFGLNHPRTKEIMAYIAGRGLAVPF